MLKFNNVRFSYFVKNPFKGYCYEYFSIETAILFLHNVGGLFNTNGSNVFGVALKFYTDGRKIK